MKKQPKSSKKRSIIRSKSQIQTASKNESFFNMNKRTLFLFIFCISQFLSIPLSAQIQYAIKGGLNAARITHDANLDHGVGYYSTPFLHLGLLANYKINDQWSIQPEVLYSQSGGIAYIDFQEINMESYKFKQTISYIKIPILLAYSFDQVNIEAGPGFGYMTGTKISRNTVEIPDYLHIFNQKIDININAGIKYTIKHFFTQIRWQYSILPIAKVNFKAVDGTIIEQVSFFSSIVQVSFGLNL